MEKSPQEEETLREEEILRADQRLRRRLMFYGGILIALAWGLARWGQPWLRKRLEREDPATAMRSLEGMLFLLFLGMSLGGGYLIRWGRRVIQQEQFPLPGQRVIRDTRIVRGSKARRRGQVLIAVGMLLILGGLASFMLTYLLFRSLFP